MKIYKEIAEINSANDFALYALHKHIIEHNLVFANRFNFFKNMDYVLKISKMVLDELKNKNYTDEEIEEFLQFSPIFKEIDEEERKNYVVC